MEKEYVQAVIILIGGGRAPTESMKEYLVRVSLETDVDYFSVRDAYYTGRLSKNAKAKFEKAAQRAENPRDVILYLQLKLTLWAKYPDRYRHRIDVVRACVESLRREDQASGAQDDAAGRRDHRGQSAEAAAGRLAPA